MNSQTRLLNLLNFQVHSNGKRRISIEAQASGARGGLDIRLDQQFSGSSLRLDAVPPDEITFADGV